MTCGIYSIYSSINDTAYIGHSSNIAKRWISHKCDLRKGMHPNPHLQNAWSLYGEDAFEFVVLENCPKELLVEREQYYFDRCVNQYNIAKVAGSRLGVPNSPETRAKISASLIGNTRSVGRKHSPETRKKISEGNRGKVLSAETREKMRQSKIGRTHSPEARAKIGAASKGNTYRRGKIASSETRYKLREARKHRPPHTLETRAKMSAAQKARWEKYREERDSAQ